MGKKVKKDEKPPPDDVVSKSYVVISIKYYLINNFNFFNFVNSLYIYIYIYICVFTG